MHSNSLCPSTQRVTTKWLIVIQYMNPIPTCTYFPKNLTNISSCNLRQKTVKLDSDIESTALPYQLSFLLVFLLLTTFQSVWLTFCETVSAIIVHCHHQGNYLHMATPSPAGTINFCFPTCIGRIQKPESKWSLEQNHQKDKNKRILLGYTNKQTNKKQLGFQKGNYILAKK